MRDRWFDKLSPSSKQAYLRAHPKSKKRVRNNSKKLAFRGPRIARKSNFGPVTEVDDEPVPKGKRRL